MHFLLYLFYNSYPQVQTNSTRSFERDMEQLKYENKYA